MGTQVYAMNIVGNDYMDECYAPYLTESRREEALKRKRPRERQLCLAAEILLNRALELSGTDVAIPAVYSRNPYGKPYLPLHTGIHINWSHSGTWAVCAISDREVGIDLQDSGKEPKEALVRRMLQPEELAFYERVPEEQRKSIFYRYWTVKESFLKAVGTGFHMSLDTFYVCMEGESPRVIQRTGGDSFACRLLEFADTDYTAAICIKGVGSGSVKDVELEYL